MVVWGPSSPDLRQGFRDVDAELLHHRGQGLILIFEMVQDSQKTNPIGASNCKGGGASQFQPSHETVHMRMIRKKPIVPTCVVIHTAS
jgi:hypothetical protein